jgi:hypothetical protein
VLAFERYLAHLYVGFEKHVNNSVGAAARHRVSSANARQRMNMVQRGTAHKNESAVSMAP